MQFERRTTCSDLCALLVVLEGWPGEPWRRLFPGADYGTWAAVPQRCRACQSPWSLTETGVRCLPCGRDVVVAAALGRRLLEARSSSVAASGR